MPRLFVALSVPETVREALTLCQGGLPDARWIDPSDYHVTLAFIGDVDAGTADRAAEELERIEAAPFDVALETYGAFLGDHGHSVHVRAALTPPLEELHHSCNGALRAAGITPEARNYAPHITVARLKRSSEPYVGPWLDGRAYAGPKTFRVESFGLFSAKAGRGGGPYDEAIRFPLTG
ncbi:MAG: RNA 2',3'-cyclic phosphodiesterase [Pseudomonadota bacterium]